MDGRNSVGSDSEFRRKRSAQDLTRRWVGGLLFNRSAHSADPAWWSASLHEEDPGLEAWMLGDSEFWSFGGLEAWGMGAWDMGLEGGILVAVDSIWDLAGFMGTGHKKNAEIVGEQTEQKK